MNVERVRGLAASTALLDELLDIRLREFRLKPTTDPAEDRHAFHGYFRREGACALLVRNTQGAILGYYGWYEEPVILQSTRVILLEPEYGFFRVEGRGGGGVARAGLRIAVEGLLQAPRVPRFLVGSVYPSSFIALSRIFGGVAHLKAPHITGLERESLGWFLRHHVKGRFDECTGATYMPTLPSERVPKSRRSQALLSEYEQQIPNWRDGYALPIIVHISPWTLLRATRDALFRARPRSR